MITEKMMNKVNTTQCKKCLYRCFMSGSKLYYCGYIIFMEHRRPCEPSPKCTVFEPYDKKERAILNGKIGMIM